MWVMNKRVMAFVIIGIIVISATAYFSFIAEAGDAIPDSTKMDTTIEPESSQKISLKQAVTATENPTISNFKIYEDGKNYTLKLEYPKIESLENQHVQSKINRVLENFVQGVKDSVLNAAQVMGSYDNAPASAYMAYEVKYNENNLLNIVLDTYIYTGGAHGIPLKGSYTFELDTGEVMQLKDFFEKNTDYISLISDQIKEQLETRDWKDSMLAPFEAIRKDQDFYLTREGLIVYFQVYEYTPYAAGMPEFYISFDSLKSHLKSSISFSR